MDVWDVIFFIFFLENLILVTINILAAYIIITSKRLRSVFNNFLLCLLFITHVTTGFFNLVRCIFLLRWVVVDPKVADAIEITRDSFTALEIHLTILLSMERYLAIRKPFMYARLGKIHASLSISVAVFFSLLFMILRILWNGSIAIATMFVFAGAVAITITNLLLYRSIKRQCREIAATIVDNSNELKLKRKKLVKDREMKSLKICLMIAVSYLLTWLVLMSGYTVLQRIKSNRYQNLKFVFAIIGFSNGIWDVMIFFHLNSTARRRIRQIVHLPTSTIETSQYDCTSVI